MREALHCTMLNYTTPYQTTLNRTMRSHTMACITKSWISTVPWVTTDWQFTAHACTAHTGTTFLCHTITTPYEQHTFAIQQYEGGKRVHNCHKNNQFLVPCTAHLGNDVERMNFLDWKFPKSKTLRFHTMKTYMHCTEPTAQDTLEHWTMMTRIIATC